MSPKLPSRSSSRSAGAAKAKSSTSKAAKANSKSSNSISNAGDEIRLQKILADAGVASRRACEELIVEGRVMVNGVVIRELGSKFNPKNLKVEVDGETIKLEKTKLYIAFYKPRGILSSMSDPEGRPTLSDYFSAKGKFHELFNAKNAGENGRVFHVGRLDKDSEGLLLLTNDGDFAFHATHPSFGLEKKYLVEVEGELKGNWEKEWLSGIDIGDGTARVKQISLVRSISNKHHWIEIVLDEGRFQVIRRMCEAMSLEVKRLIRTNFGKVSLGELKEGSYRVLGEVEMQNIFKDLQLS